MKIRLINFLLKSFYLFENPFRICRKFFEKKGEEEVHRYGETPLALWREIAHRAQISQNDRFFDLGCGRGHLCFWTALFFGCASFGVDWVPVFIRKARLIAWMARLNNVQFWCGSLRTAPIEQATVLYLYTYHPEEELVDFSRLSVGARVITVSESLSFKGFVLSQKIEGEFPWGRTEIYVNTKIY